MRLFSHYSLRIFIFLLAAVLITDTVYASGMMTSAPLSSQDEIKIAQNATDRHGSPHHCHDHVIADNSSHQSQQKSHSQNGCDDCHHCLACFSIIPPSQLKAMPDFNQVILAIPLAEIYLSPASVQPQKPPIA